METYVNDNNIRSGERFDVDFTHALMHSGDITHTSTIDHFFWNSCLDTHVLSAGVLHLPSNLSDHSPVYCVIQNKESLLQNHDINIRKPIPSWKISSEKQRMISMKKLTGN